MENQWQSVPLVWVWAQAPVRESVRDSVRDSVWDPEWDSVWDSVFALKVLNVLGIRDSDVQK